MNRGDMMNTQQVWLAVNRYDNALLDVVVLTNEAAAVRQTTAWAKLGRDYDDWRRSWPDECDTQRGCFVNNSCVLEVVGPLGVRWRAVRATHTSPDFHAWARRR